MAIPFFPKNVFFDSFVDLFVDSFVNTFTNLFVDLFANYARDIFNVDPLFHKCRNLPNNTIMTA